MMSCKRPHTVKATLTSEEYETLSALAEKAGMTPQTLRARKKSPQDFSLKELLKLGRALDIPIEELRDAIRY